MASPKAQPSDQPAAVALEMDKVLAQFIESKGFSAAALQALERGAAQAVKKLAEQKQSR